MHVHGPSGIGKTRACLEIISLLKRCEEADPIGIGSALESAALVVIDWKNNGERYSSVWDAGLSSTAMLALRICHQLWFPDVAYEIFRSGIGNDKPWIKEVFSITRVLAELSKEKKMLVVVQDEIQATFGTQVPYEGGKTGGTTEPLSRALHRALAAAVRESPLFIVGIFSGLYFEPTCIEMEPTDSSIYSIPLRPLSLVAMTAIAKSCYPSWALTKPFQLLLRALGGLPRLLEYLTQVVQQH